MYPAGSFKIGTTEFEVQIDDDGKFSTRVGQKYIGGCATKDELKKRVNAQIRKELVHASVPLTKLEGSRRYGYKAISGKAVGMHSSHGSVLVHWDNGTKEQVPSYSGRDYMGLLTEAEQAEWVKLASAKAVADEELQRFTGAHSITSGQRGLADVMRKAIDDAIKEMDVPEE